MSLESYHVSIAIDCLLILNHCLSIRKFVQNVLEQLISQKSRGNHTSVLTATRDIHVLLMWSTIASPNIPIYSCARTDAFGDQMVIFCALMGTYCAQMSIFIFFVHLRSLYYICVLSVWPCIHSSLVIPLHHRYCTTSSPYVSL